MGVHSCHYTVKTTIKMSKERCSNQSLPRKQQVY